MISIVKATRPQIKSFNQKEWFEIDVEHYGRGVKWNEKPFLFKVVEDGEIVGTVSGKHESGVLYVSTIIVAKKKRGKGIGKLLMKKAEDFGRKYGAHKVYLETGKDWDSTRFYESIGYKKEAVLPNHHFHKDFVIFSKFLK